MSTGYWVLLILTAPLWVILGAIFVGCIYFLLVGLWAPVFDAIGFLVKKIHHANSSSSRRD